MSIIDSTWLLERIAATKALIIAYETAMTTLSSGVVSYELDTGQSKQRVTRADLGSLRTTLDALENRLATLEARLCGAGTYVTPGF